MSDNFLRVIPKDPRHVPTPAAQRRAEKSLRSFAPTAEEIHSEVKRQIEFVDAGANTDTITCPQCGAIIDDAWWQAEMDRASADGFRNLAVTVPCCGASTTLNDLVYVWPAGFATYVLESMNPGLNGMLDAAQLAQLQTDLGCELKQIMAHY